jgi:hypothetical protein
MRRLLPFILVMSASCASITTNAYLMRGATIAGYETYGWGPAASLSTGDPRLDNNEIFDACVRSRVEAELDRRGFEQVNGLGMPDLLVHYHASMTQKIDTRATDPAAYVPHDEVHDLPPMVYDQGTLVIDLIDTRTNRLVWRGWAENGLDTQIDDQTWTEQRVEQAIDRIFRPLPSRLLR